MLRRPHTRRDSRVVSKTVWTAPWLHIPPVGSSDSHARVAQHSKQRAALPCSSHEPPYRIKRAAVFSAASTNQRPRAPEVLVVIADEAW